MSEVFADDAAAAEALAAANSAEVAPPTQAPVEQAPDATNENTQVDAGTNQSSESFTNIDISSVPEELRPLVEAKFKEFNADYTRKTQEIAPFRTALESAGMSAEEAQQALTFVKGLDDESNLRQLFERLSDHFDQQAQEQESETDESVDPRDTELRSLSDRLQRFEQAQAESEAKATLDMSIAAVKEAHPDFVDTDMNRIFQLATAHMQGGKTIDTAMADSAKEYADWREQTIQGYIKSKSSVSGDGTPVLGTTTHAETPTGAFKDLDEATAAALVRFGNSI